MTKKQEDGEMALEAVLKQLEAKIEELASAYAKATKREQELAAKLAEAEGRAAAEADLGTRIKALETQRDELASRLEKVLERIDATLEGAE